MEPLPDEPGPLEPGHWALVFPLYYRVLLLCCFGLWCWILNLHGLRLAGIRVRQVFTGGRVPDGMAPTLPSAVTDDRAQYNKAVQSEGQLYNLAFILTFMTLLSWWSASLISDDQGNLKRFLFLATLIVFFGIVTLPYNVLAYPDRRRFWYALGRVLNPSLTAPVFFADVVLADILTSFARVFSDSYASMCDLSTILFPESATAASLTVTPASPLTRLLSEPHHRRAHPPRSPHFAYHECGYDALAPLIILIPYALRLRQCVSEALAARNPTARRRHIANAVKYFSSFPVVVLSGYDRYLSWNGLDHDGDGRLTRHDWALTALSYLWLVAAVINTLYSVYWDVAIDWNLGYTPRWYLQSWLFGPVVPNLYHARLDPSDEDLVIRSGIHVRNGRPGRRRNSNVTGRSSYGSSGSDGSPTRDIRKMKPIVRTRTITDTATVQVATPRSPDARFPPNALARTRSTPLVVTTESDNSTVDGRQGSAGPHTPDGSGAGRRDDSVPIVVVPDNPSSSTTSPSVSMARNHSGTSPALTIKVYGEARDQLPALNPHRRSPTPVPSPTTATSPLLGPPASDIDRFALLSPRQSPILSGQDPTDGHQTAESDGTQPQCVSTDPYRDSELARGDTSTAHNQLRGHVFGLQLLADSDAEDDDERNQPCHYFLRPVLLFDSGLYYAAIVLNILLRTTWTLKISPHLPIETLPLGGFTMEWLEVVRRWLWVYFRVEREWLDTHTRLEHDS